MAENTGLKFMITESALFKKLSFLHLVLMLVAMFVGPVLGAIKSTAEIDTKIVQTKLETSENFASKEDLRDIKGELSIIRKDIQELLRLSR